MPFKKGKSLLEVTFIDLELITQNKSLVIAFFREEASSCSANWVVNMDLAGSEKWGSYKFTNKQRDSRASSELQG